MIRRSPIKSPMAQRLSHVGTKIANRGSQLIGSASSAVAQGAQLSNAVASKAGARAEEIKEHLRSPPEKTTFGVGGIRDKINKFDTASYQHRPHRNSRGTKHHRGGGGGGHESMPPPIPPPCNPSFCEKENEQNQEQYSSSSSKAVVKKVSPTFRRQKSGQKMPPTNPNYNERAARRNITNGRRRHCPTDENNETDGCQPMRPNNYNESTTEDIADQNRTAVVNINPAPGTSFYKQHEHETFSSYNMQRNNKRTTVDHSLIQSPLHKHMKGVHDSASSNAKCTMLKDPFPLLPSDCTRPLAAVANWEEKGRAGDGGMMGYLDTLGALTGRLESRRNKNQGGRGRGGGGGGGDGGGGGGGGGTTGDNGRVENDGGEAALDLLTSAAFLFKHSRRNLG